MEERLLKTKHSVLEYQAFSERIKGKVQNTKHRLELLSEQFDALSPLRLLSKGYSYVRNEEGHRVSSIKQLTEGERIALQFSDGAAAARIEEIKS
jgi:Exonuclease VII, large subunit